MSTPSEQDGANKEIAEENIFCLSHIQPTIIQTTPKLRIEQNEELESTSNTNLCYIIKNIIMKLLNKNENTLNLKDQKGNCNDDSSKPFGNTSKRYGRLLLGDKYVPAIFLNISNLPREIQPAESNGNITDPPLNFLSWPITQSTNDSNPAIQINQTP